MNKKVLGYPNIWLSELGLVRLLLCVVLKTLLMSEFYHLDYAQSQLRDKCTTGRLLYYSLTQGGLCSLLKPSYLCLRERNYCQSWEVAVTSLLTKPFLQQHPTEVAVPWAQKGGVLPLLPPCLIYSVAEGLEQGGSGDAVHSRMEYRPLCKQKSSLRADSGSGPVTCQQEGLRADGQLWKGSP